MRHSPPTVAVLGLVWTVAALTWPALYNGQPFYSFDTTAYIRGAAAGFEKAMHVTTPWSRPEVAASSRDTTQGRPATRPDVSDPVPPPAPSVSSIKDKTVLSGRSVYYGALLYLGDWLGGFWFTIIAQAVLMASALVLVLRALGVSVWPQLAIYAGILGVTTSAPFYASYLMPDMFAAVTVLVCASLIARREPLPRLDLILSLVLLALSLAFHSSHVLIAAVLLAVALVWNVVRGSWENGRGLAVIGGCLVLAACAEGLFGLAVRHFVGAPPLRPPFLMARLIEDGPGEDYLRKTCPGSGFAVCAFVDRLPMTTDEFLWEFDPGVFSTASAATRRALSAEQFRFALAVLRDRPLETFAALAHDAGRQMLKLSLAEFDFSDENRYRFTAKLPPEYRDRFRASAAYRGLVPTKVLAAIDDAVLLISVAALLAFLSVSPLRQRLTPVQVRLTALALTGALVNCVVCGVLSGPHDRYQVRVVWIVPFLALALTPIVVRHARPSTADAAMANT